MSNDEAKYEAIMSAVQMLVAMSAEDVVVFTDSQLVAQ